MLQFGFDEKRGGIHNLLLLLLFKLNTIPNLLIRGKSYQLRKCGE